MNCMLHVSPFELSHQPNRRLGTGCVVPPGWSEIAYDGSKLSIPRGIQTEGSRWVRDTGVDILTSFKVFNTTIKIL